MFFAVKIIIADEPTVLVNIDGEPQFASSEGSDLESVINTPFLIVKQSNTFYLYGGAKTWYASYAVTGPWNVAELVPANVRQLEPAEEEHDPVEPVDGNETPPAIMVATEPTELIVIDGLPQHKVIADNKLTSISNADTELFMDLETQRYFVLLSGRWFASRSYTGPWEFVAADDLPESFSKISASSEESGVRTFVAGTEEAKEAVLEASIPQTASIRRDATITG